MKGILSANLPMFIIPWSHSDVVHSSLITGKNIHLAYVFIDKQADIMNSIGSSNSLSALFHRMYFLCLFSLTVNWTLNWLISKLFQKLWQDIPLKINSLLTLQRWQLRPWFFKQIRNVLAMQQRSKTESSLLMDCSFSHVSLKRLVLKCSIPLSHSTY